ncbi:MAG: hypothetical protein QW506_07435, partial [Thermoproteota archaeon]
MTEMKPKFATVWEWGDEFEDVGMNCEKYVSKRWDETVKECSIDIAARERNEDIYYHITGFTSEPRNVRDLAQGMFDAAFYYGGNVKVLFVTIELLNSIVSNDIVCRKSIEDIRGEFEEFKRSVASRFMNDLKVKRVAEGKEVVFLIEFTLLCELEPLYANKVIVEANHFDLETSENFLNLTSKGLMEEHLAKGILGYKLHVRDVSDLEIEDTDVQR